MDNQPEWTIQPVGTKNAGRYGYRATDWGIKEKGSMMGDLIAMVPNGVTDLEDPKPGSLEMAKRILKIRELMQIVKEVSLCVVDGEAQSTHYVRDGKIEPKGSFIDLCERADKLREELEIE